MKFIRRFAAGISIICAMGFALPASADYTLSDDFHLVDNILGELDLMHEVSGTKPFEDPNAPPMAERRTRHVLQKAREVFERVQDLRHEKGLEEDILPAFPVRIEITPDDVEIVLEQILADVRDLRPVYGIKKPSPDAPPHPGKNATDVYAHLNDIIHPWMASACGNPPAITSIK